MSLNSMLFNLSKWIDLPNKVKVKDGAMLMCWYAGTSDAEIDQTPDGWRLEERYFASGDQTDIVLGASGKYYIVIGYRENNPQTADVYWVKKSDCEIISGVGNSPL